MKILFFIYSILSYLLALAAFAGFVLFLNNLWLTVGIDKGATEDLRRSLLVDFGLIALFGIQHSVMARQAFKKRWTKIVPEPAERSTYVLITSLIFFAIFPWWIPITENVWHVESSAAAWTLYALQALGWLLVFASAFAIDHFGLFGVRQGFHGWRGTQMPNSEFQTPNLYRIVRHPMQLGFLIVFWAVPQMTFGHLLFSAGMSAYIFVGLWFEERDLVRAFGERYAQYRQRVPKLIPWRKRPR